MSTLSVDTIQGKTTAGTVAMPTGGHIIQTQYSVDLQTATDVTTASSSAFVDLSGMTVSITPKFSTSKILVMYNYHVWLEKGSGVPLVATFAKRANGSSSLAPCATVTMSTVAANTVMNGTFVSAAKGGTLAFSKGEQILVSLQLTNGLPTGNKNYYVTVVFELDQSNLD